MTKHNRYNAFHFCGLNWLFRQQRVAQ